MVVDVVPLSQVLQQMLVDLVVVQHLMRELVTGVKETNKLAHVLELLLRQYRMFLELLKEIMVVLQVLQLVVEVVVPDKQVKALLVVEMV
tara:strand:- start:155 stop:424 length:270 start_codon:yes stop_codon:yes gene_type:complete